MFRFPNHTNIRVVGLHGRAGLLGPLYVLLMHCDFPDEQPLQCRCEFLDVHVVLDLSMVCEMLVCCGGQRRVCRSKVKPAPTAAEHTAIPGMRPRSRCRTAMINWKDPPSRGGRRSPAAPGREDLPARRLDGGHSPLVSSRRQSSGREKGAASSRVRRPFLRHLLLGAGTAFQKHSITCHIAGARCSTAPFIGVLSFCLLL